MLRWRRIPSLHAVPYVPWFSGLVDSIWGGAVVPALACHCTPLLRTCAGRSFELPHFGRIEPVARRRLVVQESAEPKHATSLAAGGQQHAGTAARQQGLPFAT